IATPGFWRELGIEPSPRYRSFTSGASGPSPLPYRASGATPPTAAVTFMSVTLAGRGAADAGDTTGSVLMNAAAARSTHSPTGIRRSRPLLRDSRAHPLRTGANESSG